MKILTVIASVAARYGGPSKSSRELAEALVRRGNEVSIYTTDWDGDGRLQVTLDHPVIEKGVRFRYFPIRFPRFWGYSPELGLALEKDIPTFDVVHVYSHYFYHGLKTRRVCVANRVPYLIQPHGSLDPFLYKHHRWRKWVAEVAYENDNVRNASRILYSSAEEARIAMGLVQSRPAVVVSAGLDTQTFDQLPVPGSFRSRLPNAVDKKLIVFLSRVNFKKGVDLLVEAFSKLHSKRSDVHLVIAGPDNEGYGAVIAKRIKELALTDTVTITGMISEEDKKSLFVDADVFVLPSYTENFGVAIFEAMACGLPVVISDRCNLWREIVERGAGIVTPCDSGAVADAIQKILADSSAAKVMGKSGHAMVRKDFGWDTIAAKHEQVYQAMLDGERKAETPNVGDAEQQ